MENQNIDPRDKEDNGSLERAFVGNVDATNFGGSQNEDQDQADETENNSIGTLEGKDYNKEGKNLNGQDFDTDESTGDSALENDASANDI